MSSTNDTYHQSLFVQTQPKSILKKSSSPKFLDASMGMDTALPIVSSSTYEAEKDDDVDEKPISNEEHLYILNNNNQFVNEDNPYPSSIEVPLTTKLTMTSNKIDRSLIQTHPHADSSSSPTLTSDDDDHQCFRFKPKKSSHRSFVTVGRLSSSSDNDEKRPKRPSKESKSVLLRSNKSCPTDMQLDEFIRKYQHEGGIFWPTKEDHQKEQITTKLPINHRHQKSRLYQPSSQLGQTSTNDDTLGLLESIARITQSTNISISPSQLLFNVAHDRQSDRRIKIDRIRQYVEEQIGISSFLTMYKLIKSSQIPIHVQDKPFSYYANFLPHLCCLIILESEEQKNFMSR